ncbi:MAG TPA: lanthionine synthetase LanC family protein [Longimicrobium sp.]|nr:lanthionine synthetase LanC family protein [Longimicrobium sp.]
MLDTAFAPGAAAAPAPFGTGSDFLDGAARIGARLCRQALWDGARCTWLGDAQDVSGGQWVTVHRALGPSLYDGTAGVGLFLARLHAATGEAPFRTAARGALRQALSRADAVAPPVRVALHAGLTGVAWALALAADALGEEDWAEEARGLAEAIEGAEPHPQAVDVVSGAAGAIPALLFLAGRLDRPSLAEAALRQGDFLLAQARRGPTGWSWRTIDMPARADLTGYSHGAAGIGVALLELAAATGEGRFREGADEAFRYEAACYSPAHGNWPDFRVFGDPAAAPAEPAFSMAWCHGAPGIALSRLRAWRLTADPARRAEAEAALAATARSLEPAAAGPSQGLSLCHGDAGNAESLLAAAEVLGEPAWRALPERVGRSALAHFGGGALPWPCGVPGGGETPALMLGTAGIGWFFLRLHDPSVPSVLVVTADGGA